MTLTGNITDFPLTEIVQIIGVSKRTGTLVLDGEISKLSIGFIDGKPVQTDSENNREKIGELLLKNNEVDRRDVIDAILIQQRQHENGDSKRIGKILIEMGTVSPNTISKYISTQIKESLYDILSERKGTFRFNTGDTNHETDDLISLNVEELILQGLRQIDERVRIKDTLLSAETVYKPNKRKVDKDGPLLTNDERLVLSLVDGHRTVEDIFGLIEIPRFDVIQILYKLLNKSFIEINK